MRRRFRDIVLRLQSCQGYLLGVATHLHKACGVDAGCDAHAAGRQKEALGLQTLMAWPGQDLSTKNLVLARAILADIPQSKSQWQEKTNSFVGQYRRTSNCGEGALKQSVSRHPLSLHVLWASVCYRRLLARRMLRSGPSLLSSCYLISLPPCESLCRTCYLLSLCRKHTASIRRAAQRRGKSFPGILSGFGLALRCCCRLAAMLLGLSWLGQ